MLDWKCWDGEGKLNVGEACAGKPRVNLGGKCWDDVWNMMGKSKTANLASTPLTFLRERLDGSKCEDNDLVPRTEECWTSKKWNGMGCWDMDTWSGTRFRCGIGYVGVFCEGKGLEGTQH